jgi:hypothetical protein
MHRLALYARPLPDPPAPVALLEALFLLVLGAVATLALVALGVVS